MAAVNPHDDIKALFNIICDMKLKISQLEKRLDDYEKCYDPKKRKVNIVEMLNTKYNPFPVSYIQWFNSIKINRTHLEMVFEMDCVLGISAILELLLPSPHNNEENTLPIKCFSQNENILFIFNNDKWDIMPDELFNELINSLSNKLFSECILWRDENMEKIENDDSFAIVYSKNMKKLIGGEVSVERLRGDIKKKIFKYLKTKGPSS